MPHRIATRLLSPSVAVIALVVAYSTMSLIHAQRSEMRAIPKGPNVLLGRVLDAGTDAPVADAVVNLVGFFDRAGRSPAGVPTSMSVPDASAPRSVMTNGDGYFLFRDLPAGKYAVAAQAFGYIIATYPIRVVEIVDGDKPTSALLRLSKFASISGRVFDDQGDSLSGVTVLVLQRLLIGGRLVLRGASSQTQTDDRGIYRLANVLPGSYIVGVISAPETIPVSLANEIDRVATNPDALRAAFGGRFTSGEGLRVGEFVLQQPRRDGARLQVGELGIAPFLAPDGKVLTSATTFFPGTQIPADATLITLGSGEQRAAVDFALRLQPTVRVSGTVTGPDGPMKRLELRLVLPGSAYPTADAVGAATAITDANGAFTFLAIASGQYELQAAVVNMQFTDANAPDHPLWVAQELVIGDSDITGLALVMKAGLRVGGRVEFKSSPGSALRDQRITMHLQPLGADMWQASEARSAADGTFQTGGDPPGRYMINVSTIPLNPSSTTTWNLSAITRGGKPIPDSIIDLDAEVLDLVVTFSDRPTRMAGSVKDASGAPDVDSDVIVFPADTTLWREGIFANSRRVRKVHATSSATFEIGGMQPGQYYCVAVSARLTGDWQDPQFLEQLLAGATKVTVGDGEERTVALKTFAPKDR